jgi:hypothetical protein
VHAVRQDIKKKGLLLAGTETGVYVSFNDGARWQALQLNLPHAPVYDLVVHDDDLVVATHGLAFWILDDISPLRQVTTEIASSSVYLFKPDVAYRIRGSSGSAHGAVGENAPSGAIVYYYLKKSPPKDKTSPQITLDILDSRGRTVREFTDLGRKRDEETEGPPEEPRANTPRDALPAKAGLNRFVWDPCYQGPREIPHAGAVYSDWQPDHPLALPGEYELKLIADGRTLMQPLRVKLDPRVDASAADLQKQFDLAMKIRDEVSAASDTVNEILDLEVQLNGLESRLAGDAGDEPLIALAKSVAEKASAVANALYEPDVKASEDSLNYPIRLRYQLAALGDVVDSADAPPTAQCYSLYETLSRQLDAQLARWRDIQAKDVHALNALALKSRLGVVMVAPQRHGEP